MTHYLIKTCFVIFLFLQMSLTHADTDLRWNSNLKNKYIQECTSIAKEKSLPLYRTAFQGKMSAAEYTAFIQSINQGMADDCRCIVTKISKTMSYQDFISKPDNVSELADSLSQTGAACAPNMNAMVNRIKNQLGILN